MIVNTEDDGKNPERKKILDKSKFVMLVDIQRTHDLYFPSPLHIYCITGHDLYHVIQKPLLLVKFRILPAIRNAWRTIKCP